MMIDVEKIEEVLPLKPGVYLLLVPRALPMAGWGALYDVLRKKGIEIFVIQGLENGVRLLAAEVIEGE